MEECSMKQALSIEVNTLFTKLECLFMTLKIIQLLTCGARYFLNDKVIDDR